MRCLVVLLLVLVMSCSDEENGIIVEPDKMPFIFEIPEGIPQGLAEHFAGLQEHMTQEEWHLVLDQVNKACTGEAEYIFETLEEELSEEAWTAVEKVKPLTPSALNTEESRIWVMGWILPDVHHVALEYNGAYVLHQKHTYVVVLEVDGLVDKTGTGNLTRQGHYGFSSLNPQGDEARARAIVEEIVEEWGNQWREEFHPRFEAGEFDNEPVVLLRSKSERVVKRVRDFFNDKFIMPQIPQDLDLFIVFLDPAYNPLRPEEVEGIWYNREDAPQATQKQLTEYNRVHSSDTYDCVGVK